MWTLVTEDNIGRCDITRHLSAMQSEGPSAGGADVKQYKVFRGQDSGEVEVLINEAAKEGYVLDKFAPCAIVNGIVLYAVMVRETTEEVYSGRRQHEHVTSTSDL